MTRVRLREAAGADVPALVRVIESAYRGTEGARGWTSEVSLVKGARTDEAEVRALIADPRSLLLLAEDATGADTPQGRVLGCCAVHPLEEGTVHAGSDGAAADVLEFGLFAVDPAAQSGGVGRALLEGAAERAARRGAQELLIRVLQSRPELRAWYERRGFVPTGEVVPFAGRAEDLLVGGLAMDVLVLPLP